MSTAIVQPLSDPTCVDFSFEIEVINGERQLIIVKTNVIELYEIAEGPANEEWFKKQEDPDKTKSGQQNNDDDYGLPFFPLPNTHNVDSENNVRNTGSGRLRLICALPLLRKVTAASRIRHPSYPNADLLCVVFRNNIDINFSIMRYDLNVGNFRTISAHVIQTDALDLRRDSKITRLCTDPDNRCLLLQIDPCKLIVFPFLEKVSTRRGDLNISNFNATRAIVSPTKKKKNKAHADTGSTTQQGEITATGGIAQQRTLAFQEEDITLEELQDQKLLGDLHQKPFHMSEYMETPLFPSNSHPYVLNVTRSLKLYAAEEVRFLRNYSLTRPTLAISGKESGINGSDIARHRSPTRLVIAALSIKAEETHVVWRSPPIFSNSFTLEPLYSGLFMLGNHSVTFCEHANLTDVKMACQMTHDCALLLEDEIEEGNWQNSSHLNLDLSDASISVVKDPVDEKRPTNTVVVLLKNYRDGTLYLCDVIRNPQYSGNITNKNDFVGEYSEKTAMLELENLDPNDPDRRGKKDSILASDLQRGQPFLFLWRQVAFPMWNPLLGAGLNQMTTISNDYIYLASSASGCDGIVRLVWDKNFTEKWAIQTGINESEIELDGKIGSEMVDVNDSNALDTLVETSGDENQSTKKKSAMKQAMKKVAMKKAPSGKKTKEGSNPFNINAVDNGLGVDDAGNIDVDIQKKQLMLKRAQRFQEIYHELKNRKEIDVDDENNEDGLANHILSGAVDVTMDDDTGVNNDDSGISKSNTKLKIVELNEEEIVAYLTANPSDAKSDTEQVEFLKQLALVDKSSIKLDPLSLEMNPHVALIVSDWREECGRLRTMSGIHINSNGKKGTGKNWTPGFLVGSGYGHNHSWLHALHASIPTAVRATIPLPKGEIPSSRDQAWALPQLNLMQGSKASKSAKKRRGSTGEALTTTTEFKNHNQNAHLSRYLIIPTESYTNLVLDVEDKSGKITEVAHSYFAHKNLIHVGPHYSLAAYWVVQGNGSMALLDANPSDTSISSGFRRNRSSNETCLEVLLEADITENIGSSTEEFYPTHVETEDNYVLQYDKKQKLMKLFRLQYARQQMNGSIYLVQELEGVLACTLYGTRFLVVIMERNSRLSILQFPKEADVQDELHNFGGSGVAIMDLQEVFSCKHINDVPPLLRDNLRYVKAHAVYLEKKAEEEAAHRILMEGSKHTEESSSANDSGSANEDIINPLDYLKSNNNSQLTKVKSGEEITKWDRLRAITDYTAEPENGGDIAFKAGKFLQIAMLDLDTEDDVGPTLVILQEERPLIIYRSHKLPTSDKENTVRAACPLVGAAALNRTSTMSRQSTTSLWRGLLSSSSSDGKSSSDNSDNPYAFSLFPFDFKLEVHKCTNIVRAAHHTRIRKFSSKTPGLTGNGILIERWSPTLSGGLFVFAKRNKLYLHPANQNPQPLFQNQSDKDMGFGSGTDGFGTEVGAIGPLPLAAIPPPNKRFAAIVPFSADCVEDEDLAFLALKKWKTGNKQQGEKVEYEIEIHSLNNAVNLHTPILKTGFKLPRTPVLVSVDPGSAYVAVAMCEPSSGDIETEVAETEGDTILEEPKTELKPEELLQEEEDNKGPNNKTLNPRLVQRFVVEVYKLEDPSELENEKTLEPVFTFDFKTHESVQCISWMRFKNVGDGNAGKTALCIGTGINHGEDLTCKGRILVFMVNTGNEERATGAGEDSSAEEVVASPDTTMGVSNSVLMLDGDGINPNKSTSLVENKPKESKRKPFCETAVPVFSKYVKGPIMAMCQLTEDLLVYSFGYKVHVHKWVKDSGLQLVTFYDSGFCVTSLTTINPNQGGCQRNNTQKNIFLIVGDLKLGVEMLRWHDGRNGDGVRKLERMSRTAHSSNVLNIAGGNRKLDMAQSTFPILKTDYIIEQQNLGVVATDANANLHLFQYLPVADGTLEGDRILKSAGNFHLGSQVRCLERIERNPTTSQTQKKGLLNQTTVGAGTLNSNNPHGKQKQALTSLFMGSKDGSFSSLLALADTKFRILNTLCNNLTAKIPFQAGANPRAYRAPNEYAGVFRKTVEDGALLSKFLFLSQPLQQTIADRIQIPLPQLVKHVEEAVRNDPFL